MSKLRGNWRVRECSERMEHVLDKLYKAEVEDKHTQLSDVLGDLMHFAYRHDLDFESALDSAYGYVSVERAPYQDLVRALVAYPPHRSREDNP